METVNAQKTIGSEGEFLKILLAEEDDVKAFVIQCELNKLNTAFSCKRASTREQYLQLLKEFRPGMVLANYDFAGIHLFTETRELAPSVEQVALVPKPDKATRDYLAQAGVRLCLSQTQLPMLSECLRLHANPAWGRIEDSDEHEDSKAPNRGVTRSGKDKFLHFWSQWAGGAWEEVQALSQFFHEAALRLKTLTSRELRRFFQKRALVAAGSVRESELAEFAQEPLLHNQFVSGETQSIRLQSPAPIVCESVSDNAFDVLFASPLAAILLVDNSGHIVRANQRAGALLGSTPLRNQSLFEIISKSERSRMQNAWKGFINTGQLAGQFEILSSSDSSRQTELQARPNIFPGLHLIMLHDLTESLQLKQRAEQLQMELERYLQANRKQREQITELQGRIYQMEVPPVSSSKYAFS